MLAIGFAALAEIEEAMNHLRVASRGAPRGTDLSAGREWGVWKGVHLDPETSTLEAPVYLPGDANCCPSFVARLFELFGAGGKRSRPLTRCQPRRARTMVSATIVRTLAKDPDLL